MNSWQTPGNIESTGRAERLGKVGGFLDELLGRPVKQAQAALVVAQPGLVCLLLGHQRHVHQRSVDRCPRRLQRLLMNHLTKLKRHGLDPTLLRVCAVSSASKCDAERIGNFCAIKICAYPYPI